VIARPYVMPPGTPDEFVRIMREAFGKALADRELLAEANKAGMDVAYTSADEALRVMREVLAQPKDIVDEFSKYVKFGE
jgi:tripartite-type tricarboxylate transporter receptor subunit TctC